MVASKVTITQETREKLSNQALSPTKKRKLREQMIIESIRRAVGGVRTKQELVAAAGFNPNGHTSGYANGFNLIHSMIKRGIISHLPTSSYKKTWTVHADVNVNPSPKQVAEAVVPKEVVVELADYTVVDKLKLKDMAKEFSWRENSDSLRDFIAYMENAIK